MKFIKRQILDEREVQLINKAGTEAFSLLMISNFIFYFFMSNSISILRLYGIL